jgi:hypothetical protein
MTKTDITNRALTLYFFFSDIIRHGDDVLIKNRVDGKTFIVKLL